MTWFSIIKSTIKDNLKETFKAKKVINKMGLWHFFWDDEDLYREAFNYFTALMEKDPKFKFRYNIGDDFWSIHILDKEAKWVKEWI